MNIEHGKTYLNRAGEKRRVVLRGPGWCLPGTPWPFIDQTGCTYSRSGCFQSETVRSELDLVERFDNTEEDSNL
jgi:hypothetical protein